LTQTNPKKGPIEKKTPHMQPKKPKGLSLGVGLNLNHTETEKTEHVNYGNYVLVSENVRNLIKIKRKFRAF